MAQEERGQRKVNTSGARGTDRPIEPYPIRPRRPVQTPPDRRQTVKREPAAKTASGRRTKKSPPPGRKAEPQKRRPQSEGAQRRRMSRGELRRRRRIRRIWTIVFLLALVTAGVILSCTVLFRVKNFRMENLDKTTPADTGIYTEEAILGMLGIPAEENIFSFLISDKEKEMMLIFPYLETIQIRRSLPSTIVVRVEPAVESWCVQQGSRWAVLSAGLKVLKYTDAPIQELPVIYGLKGEEQQPGLPYAIHPVQVQAVMNEEGKLDEDATKKAQEQADLKAQEDLKELKHLLKLLETYGLKDDITAIDLHEENEAAIVYQNRIKVCLGTFNNLDYKLKTTAKLAKNETGEFLDAADHGTLDVSHQLDGQITRFTFSPGDFTIGPTEPEVPPEPPAAVPEGETGPAE